MGKKNYQKPSMLVIKMERTGVLMDSGVAASKQSYGEANSDNSIPKEEKSDGVWYWN